jgi:hypothetical protein
MLCAIGIAFIPDFSVNELNPIMKSAVIVLAGLCLLYAAPAWIVSGLLGGRAFDAQGHFRMPLLGRMLLVLQLTATIYGAFRLLNRWRSRRKREGEP